MVLVHLRLKWTPGGWKRASCLKKEVLRGIEEAAAWGAQLEKAKESSKKDGSVKVGICELVTGHGNMIKCLYVK